MTGRIEIVQSDITTLAVDAIVNAANSSLLGGGGVDGAIQRAAGPRLLKATHALGGCPTGEARITPGFDLPARWVIHAVGPIWQGGDAGEDAARQYGVASIAFPAISTGAYGYPMDRAARIALREVTVALRSSPAIARVIIALRGDDAFYIHRDVQRKLSDMEE
jgi:O-acetyl-ADP-ribose deacetylase (regulator of RNase III)